jgi:hypothetical protein
MILCPGKKCVADRNSGHFKTEINCLCSNEKQTAGILLVKGKQERQMSSGVISADQEAMIAAEYAHRHDVQDF